MSCAVAPIDSVTCLRCHKLQDIDSFAARCGALGSSSSKCCWVEWVAEGVASVVVGGLQTGRAKCGSGSSISSNGSIEYNI